MKIYIASIITFSMVDDAIDSDTKCISMSIPAFIPADTVQAAAEVAKAHAFERWPPTEGWYGHQANVMVATKEIYESLLGAAEAGALDMSDEPPLTFTWDQDGNLLN